MDLSELPVEFGRYTLLNRLGEGGMACVYRAKLSGPAGFRKEVALKVMKPPRENVSSRQVEAFLREARLGGLLRHPNIVDVYELGEEQGCLFIAMELVDGLDLHSLLRRMGPPEPAQALDIAMQVCAGLEHAHGLVVDGERVPVVHRDLKPSNILLSVEGVARIMDFGIAKARRVTDTTTMVGGVRGSPAYMSPEQIEGHHVDQRSDLFSLGALLYELLTGKRLFQGEQFTSVLLGVLNVEELLAETDALDLVESLVPGLRQVMEAARSQGAHSAALSGAGPTVIALASKNQAQITSRFFIPRASRDAPLLLPSLPTSRRRAARTPAARARAARPSTVIAQ